MRSSKRSLAVHCHWQRSPRNRALTAGLALRGEPRFVVSDKQPALRESAIGVACLRLEKGIDMAAQKTTGCLWLTHEAEAAIRFYVDLIPESQILSLNRTPGPDGSETVLASFVLGGVEYRAIGAPAEFHLTDAFSISVRCADQAEVDRYWEALTADGGRESMCGWLIDRWGLSWQIVPARLEQLMGDPDPARAGRATQAMLQMRKIVIADLEAAADAAE